MATDIETAVSMLKEQQVCLMAPRVIMLSFKLFGLREVCEVYNYPACTIKSLAYHLLSRTSASVLMFIDRTVCEENI